MNDIIPSATAPDRVHNEATRSRVEGLFEGLRTSIEAALGSGIERVAKARRARALEIHGTLHGLDLPDEIRRELDRFVMGMEERFPTAWRVNLARDAVALARDPEGRRGDAREALENARRVLEEGRGETGVDAEALERAVAAVESALGTIGADDVGAPAPGSEPEPGWSLAEPDLPFEALDPRVDLTLEAAAILQPAVVQGAAEALVGLRVENGSRVAVRGAVLELEADPPVLVATSLPLADLEPGQALELGRRELAPLARLDGGAMAGLDGEVPGDLRAMVRSADGDVIGEAHHTWRVLPMHVWPGLDLVPERLASFVLPGDPWAAELAAAAAEGVDGEGPARSLALATAAFEALAAHGVTRAAAPGPPAAGGAVRFPSKVGGTRLAAPLDLALTLCAILEGAGLGPLIVFADGAVLCGAWLVDETFASPVIDDVARFLKRVELGEIICVDPTLAAGAGAGFRDARRAADEILARREAFVVAIDVKRARLGGAAPLAVTGTERAGPVGGGEARDLEAAAEIQRARELRLREETPETRVDRWLRQLLDLTMRNRLLNAGRSSKRVMPLLAARAADVEDALSDGRTFRLQPAPPEVAGIAEPSHEELAPIEGLLAEGVRRGELFAPFPESELRERLLHLYREARTAREEGGASSLYLAVGSLVYREAKNPERERVAPLLLLPLDLTRESVRAGFRIGPGDDEPRVNVTLVESLRRDHDIDIVGVDPLPEDESGVDVALVLRLFRDAVKHMPDWRVDDTLSLGMFSFAKYLLWRDLKERRGELGRSALVEHLIERPHEPFQGGDSAGSFPDPRRLDEEVSAEEVFAPLSYDSSQLSAILAAARGATMVLEGPPGTGKSQTITNLIAQAIGTGKTVLFVAEKLAALDVVHSRLEGLGLGPACLELHSSKASKKAVLAQFAEALDAGRVRGARRREWASIAAEVDGLRGRLNGHVAALHGERASGQSVHGMVAGGASARAAFEGEPLLDVPDPLGIDAETMARWRTAIGDLDDVGVRQAVGPDHPLLRVGRTETSPLIEASTRAALASFDAPAGAFIDAVLELAELAGGDSSGIDSPEGWRALREVLAAAEALAPMGRVPDWLVSKDELDAIGRDIDTARALAAYEGETERSFRASPESLDLDAMEELRRAWIGGGFFARWKAKRALASAFRGIARAEAGKIDVHAAVEALDRAQAAREQRVVLGASASHAPTLLGAAWRGAETDADAADARLALARRFHDAWRSLVEATRVAPAVASGLAARALGGEVAAVDLERVGAALDAALDGYHDAVAAVSEAAEPDAGAIHWHSLDGARAARDEVRGWRDGWGGLLGWTRWRAARARAMEAGLGPVVRAIEAGAAAPGDLAGRFADEMRQRLALHEVSADDALKAFEGGEHERLLERFAALDAERLEAAREEVRQSVGSRRPKRADVEAAATGRAATGLGLLQREITKKARHIAIRRLLAELGEAAMDLKPCFLMSPMSVAQYLESDHPPFDLVVFDEASQIPVWDAIGAIARGRQAVIVGDPRQLPPTSFFARGAASDDELDLEDGVEDLESILDECLAAGVPTRRLEWHYRSRDESLIAFSNERYYGGELVTFPSGAGAGAAGVHSRFVEGGTYEKGRSRTNPTEARAVVAEVLERLRSPGASRSIGVVTFSQPQQTLIQDLFERAITEEPELERWFAEGEADGVFVKNLENVQGDERDLIVFSIGYGPDPSGRVSMNFGPLNKDGGERRLNVAVTRARREVLVFTSLRAADIDPARTSARGVRDLRAFLAFAERRSAARSAAERVGADGQPDGLVASIAAELTARGHRTVTGIGRSGVRIDIGVVDPGDPSRFLLAIETDGANYRRSATARDRDRLRGDVLGSLGWRVHRVWAIDWWRDREAVLRGIDEALRTARER